MVNAGERTGSRYLMVTVVLLSFVSVCIVTTPVKGDSTLDSLHAMWSDGQYDSVLLPLLEYRETPFGKNLEVDYMLATAMCRSDRFADRGFRLFGWMLRHYPVYGENRKILEREMGRCDARTIPEYIDFAAFWASIGSAGASGKAYHLLNDTTLPLANGPVEVIKKIPMSDFDARLVPLTRDHSDTSIAAWRIECSEYLQSWVADCLPDSRFTVRVYDHFAIVSLSSQSAADLDRIGGILEIYLSFYEDRYGIRRPDNVITVFLVPDAWQMRRLARSIHGLRIPRASIGYSFRHDLSIVGVIPGTICGTLAHELFHLVVRGDFGDIPPWLDEGMAALYEVSVVADSGIIGVPNWRGRILDMLGGERPTIEELVKMDWLQFDNPGGHDDQSQQAINHAKARYFILFLQERGRLAAVFEAFRGLDIMEVGADLNQQTVDLLESALETDIAQVDSEFAEWFHDLRNRQ